MIRKMEKRFNGQIVMGWVGVVSLMRVLLGLRWVLSSGRRVLEVG